MTMHWMFPALAAQLAYVASIYVDKIVISRVGVNQRLIASVTAIVRLTSAGALLLCFGLPNARAVDMALMLLIGVFEYVYLIPYFVALDRADASSIAPLFLTVPAFALLLGLLGIGEVPPAAAVPGLLVTVFGALVFQVGRPTHPRHGSTGIGPVALMLTSAACAATGLALFGELGSAFGYAQTLGVVQAGSGISALVASRVFKPAGPPATFGVFGWVLVASEVLAACGDALMNRAATLTAPAVAAAAEAFQPLFLVATGLVLTWRFPHVLREDVSRASIARKAFGSLTLAVGLVLLATNT